MLFNDVSMGNILNLLYLDLNRISLSLRVPTHIGKHKKGLFFHKTTWTYRCTFFLCFYLPKLSNNIYSLKF